MSASICLGRLAALEAQGLRPDEDRGDRGIHERYLECAFSFDLERIRHPARGQKFPGEGPGAVRPVQDDLGAGSRHAVDSVLALHCRMLPLHGDFRDDHLARVDLVDPDFGHRLHRFHQSLVDGEGADGCRDISAVGFPVDHRFDHADLAEKIVHVAVRTGGRPDDRRLAREEFRPAYAVNLPRVGGAENAHDHLVPQGLVLRQIVPMKKNALARAAPHDGAANEFLIFHTIFLPIAQS